MNLHTYEALAFYMLVTAYTLCMVLYLIGLAAKYKPIGCSATILACIGLAVNTTLIIERMIISGHPPLSNGYEFLLTFAWAIMAIYLNLLCENASEVIYL